MTHEQRLAHYLPPDTGLIGCEVGAGGRPLPGLVPPAIQVDCFKAFGADTCTADFYGHACALPFHDHALDYVLASHVLEHVANPLAAVLEWARVVRPGGLLYVVVPWRLATWDRTRALTAGDHFLADFVHGTTASDATHIDEFAADVAPEFFGPELSAEALAARRAELARGLHETVARGEDINIHFHTFEPANLHALLAHLTSTTSRLAPPASRLSLELLELTAGFPTDCPNGILAVLRVHKGWLARAAAEAVRIRATVDPAALLLPTAESFATWSARTPGLGGVTPPAHRPA